MSLSETEIALRLIPLEKITWDSTTADKPAAVLIPFWEQDHQWQILFLERSDTVALHKGQVSFPGGGKEAGEDLPSQTALREFEEETGISRSSVSLWGGIPPITTSSHYRVIPLIGKIPTPRNIRLEPIEAKEAFSIPLEWFLKNFPPQSLPVREKFPGSSSNRISVFFPDFRGHLVWGATAQMMISLIGICFPPN